MFSTFKVINRQQHNDTHMPHQHGKMPTNLQMDRKSSRSAAFYLTSQSDMEYVFV